MGFISTLHQATRPLLDYALPPRCPACGVITLAPDSLCGDCWQEADFLIGTPTCDHCGRDLPGLHKPATCCAACLVDPPAFDRACAVLNYGQVGRTIAHRLKYGRRVSLARIMAGHMARLRPEPADPAQTVLTPVPLHRWRIWSRGFNQSALLADRLGKLWQVPCETDVLKRVVNTPPLHSLGPKARHRALRGAFRLTPQARQILSGKTVLLIDDILTTGATAAACATLLKRGGAARVELLCWARTGGEPNYAADLPAD